MSTAANMAMCVTLGSPCNTMASFCYGSSCTTSFFSTDHKCCPISTFASAAPSGTRRRLSGLRA